MEVVSNSLYSAMPEGHSKQQQSGKAMTFTRLNLGLAQHAAK